ncbi:hypothetical protein QU487_06725 [Crenobacter sp. SG2305]|uniref:hypothetical protein n=1 Tax=Crenobacter oryzisoli TaxID=3056844 RepID=UPI0025AB1ECD|nr:hypothetical protein [Crenobacter sp. SG2305]MDN0082448.1 hypothetical protein [Crenobacter sp. SG2305]
MDIQQQFAVLIGEKNSWEASVMVIERYADGSQFLMCEKDYCVLRTMVRRSTLCVTGEIRRQGKPLLPEDYVLDWSKRLNQVLSLSEAVGFMAGYLAQFAWGITEDYRWETFTRSFPNLVDRIELDADRVVRNKLDLSVCEELECFIALASFTDKYTLETLPAAASTRPSTAVPEVFVDDEQLSLF